MLQRCGSSGAFSIKVIVEAIEDRAPGALPVKSRWRTRNLQICGERPRPRRRLHNFQKGQPDAADGRGESELRRPAPRTLQAHCSCSVDIG